MPSNVAMVEICYSCKEKFCCSSSCPYDKLPALLSCQHLICYGCIQRIWVNLDIDDNNKLLCPVCNILTFLSPSTHHISFYFNKFCSNCAIKNGQIRNKLREKRTEQSLITIRPETSIAFGSSSTPQERNGCDSGSNLRIVQVGIGDINISGRPSQNVESNLANQEANSKDKQIVTKSRNQSNSKKLFKKQKKNSQQKTSHSGHSQMKNERNSQKTTRNSIPDTKAKKLVPPHQTRTNLNTSIDGKIEKNLNQDIKNSANKEILPSVSEKSSMGPHHEQDSEYGRAYSRLSSSSNSSGETDIKTNNTSNSQLNKLDSKTDSTIVKSSTQKGCRVKNNRTSNRESNIVKTTQHTQKKDSRNTLLPREGLQIPVSLNVDDLVETRTSTSTQSLPNMSLLSCCKYDVEGKSKSNTTNVTSSNLGQNGNGGVRRNGGSLSDDASNINQRKVRSSGRNRKPGSKMHWKMKPIEDDSDTECIPPLRKRGFLYRRECFKILDCIYNNEKSELFRHEIKSKYVSDYYKVVKRGMCLDIIAYKIRNNIYTHVKEFSTDMYRIFDNCRLYNQYGSEAYEAANIVQNLFNQKMIECFSN
ncbi:Bromodomain adjacent to zinc finger domain 2B [Octopus vulgaris]|uniref:Bromodomain adjacent to zinc finger domain 2B n=1 Tax=Octopus vulgaris TaxID=6645 RepID=A0AA36EW50_OCTVU|nr:Bromodomain adjacent to zinc finger domain 2B [Octopus vulgaris]